jgi:transcriptional regulator with XRE-family HTH domain
MNVGKNIREAREAQGLLISEVARRAGLTSAGVMSVESGRVRNPGVGTVVQIARALGVEPGELLTEEPRPLVVALPSTPVTDTPVEDLDEWLRSTGSAAEVDKKLRAVEAEARDLEEFIPRHVAPKLDRARLYRAALLDRWVKLADKRRKPESNRFKSVADVANDLGGRFRSIAEADSEQAEPKDMPPRAETNPENPMAGADSAETG